MTIDVTAEWIALGWFSTGSNPVALAIRERLNRHTSCNAVQLWIRGINNDAPLTLPANATEWLTKYFDRQHVYPFTLELPDDVLATARPGTTLDDRQHI